MFHLNYAATSTANNLSKNHNIQVFEIVVVPPFFVCVILGGGMAYDMAILTTWQCNKLYNYILNKLKNQKK